MTVIDDKNGEWLSRRIVSPRKVACRVYTHRTTSSGRPSRVAGKGTHRVRSVGGKGDIAVGAIYPGTQRVIHVANGVQD